MTLPLSNLPGPQPSGLTLTVPKSQFPFSLTIPRYIPELEEQDWAVVNGGNALCHGIRLIREKPVPTNGTPAATTTDPRGIPVGLETARYPGTHLH